MPTYLYLDQDDADTLDDLITMESFTIVYDKESPSPWSCTIGVLHGQGATLRDSIRAAISLLFRATAEEATDDRR